MGASLIAAHLHGGVAFADNTTTVESMLSIMSSTSQATAWRLRGTSGATIDQLKTYASANTTLVTTTITARKNASGQTLAVSYTSGQTGEKQDTSNSFSASNGDDIDVSVAVPNDVSGAKTITIHSITMRCTPTTPGDTVGRVGANTSTAGVGYSTASQVNYFAAGALGSNTTERPLRALGSFTLSNLQTHVTANARTTTTTYRSRKNGANGAQSVKYTSGQTGLKEDTTNTDSIVSGDDWCMSQTTGTGAGTITLLACTMAVKSAAGEFELVAADVVGTGYPNSSTRYGCCSGPFTNTNTTESNAQSRGFAATYKNLRTYCPANTAGSDCTVTLRVEGADSALSVTYTAGQTGLKTDTDTVAVSDDDLIGYKIVAGSGTGNTLTLTSIAVTGVTSIGLSPASIASTAAIGTPSFTETITPTGVASTTAVGTPALSITIAPVAVASTAALGTPNIDLIPDGGGSSIDVSPIGIDSTASVGTPALSLATMSPASIASSLALGVAAIAAISIAPVGIASTSDVGAPTLSLSVTPSGVATTASCGTPALSLATCSPMGVDSTIAVGAPTLAIAVSATGIDSTTTLGTPALSVTASPASIASTIALGAPTLALAFSPASVTSTASLGAPTLAFATTTTAIDSTTTLGTPALSITAAPVGIDSTIAAGAPSVTTTVAPTGIDSTTAFGAPTLSLDMAPAAIESTTTFGTAHAQTVTGARSGWHATAYVRPWSATGRAPAWGFTVYVHRAWSATGRRL